MADLFFEASFDFIRAKVLNLSGGLVSLDLNSTVVFKQDLRPVAALLEGRDTVATIVFSIIDQATDGKDFITVFEK